MYDTEMIVLTDGWGKCHGRWSGALELGGDRSSPLRRNEGGRSASASSATAMTVDQSRRHGDDSRSVKFPWTVVMDRVRLGNHKMRGQGIRKEQKMKILSTCCIWRTERAHTKKLQHIYYYSPSDEAIRWSWSVLRYYIQSPPFFSNLHYRPLLHTPELAARSLGIPLQGPTGWVFFSRLQFDQYVAGVNGTLRESNASPVVGLEEGTKEIQRRCCFCFVSFLTCNAPLYRGVSSSFLYSLSNSDWTGRVALHHRHPILFCYFYMRTYPGNSSQEDIHALTKVPWGQQLLENRLRLF